ncbi:MAG: HNH endonuclease [Desulfobacteraceae bacterium]|nr:HNH endonuclease [Desulfobacteraceae bacterium]
MPWAPKRTCASSYCPNLVDYGYCDECQAKRAKTKPRGRDRRPNSAKRGYDHRWRAARHRFLAKHPLCCRCRSHSRIEPATVVDHKIPHRGDMRLFWNSNNWQALCEGCHNAKTARGE